MDARKVIFSFAVLVICAVAAFPQNPEDNQEYAPQQDQYERGPSDVLPSEEQNVEPKYVSENARRKRYVPYGAYSTVHSYSYLTPYPNSIKSVHYAPPVYAAAPVAAAYHAPVAYHAPIAAAYHAPVAPVLY